MTTLFMPVPQSDSQMMSFLVKNDDTLLVFDGGNSSDADFLCAYIRKLGGTVDGWFFTHPHAHHINAFSSLCERHAGEISIKRLYLRFLPAAFVEASGETDETAPIDRFARQVDRLDLPVTGVSTGDVFRFPGITVRVLLAPDEAAVPGPGGVNDSSVVYRLEAGDHSVVFLGDLGVKGGERLLAEAPASLLKADYVQTAHHGQDGVGKAVYDAVGARFYLWCTPLWLWSNDMGEGYDTGHWKTIVTRGWVSEIGAEWHYISGEGTQEIVLETDDDPYPRRRKRLHLDD